MTIDIPALKALAQKATPGEWIQDDDCGYSKNDIWSGCTPSGSGAPGIFVAQAIGDSAQAEENAAYIAAANPATVLALIERVEKAEAPTAEDIAWAEGEGKKVISGEYGEANRPSVFARLEAAEAKIKYLRQTAVTWRYSYRRQHERADAAEADAARLREALVNETAIPYSSKPGFWCYMCDGCGLDAETIAHNQPCVLAVKP